MKQQELNYKQAQFRRFAQEQVRPYAQWHDHNERIAGHLVPALAGQGYLAPFLPPRWGGVALDMVTLGILHEEIGCACSSVRSLLTVHGMAAHAILRWGSEAVRARWLAALSSGDAIGALAVSEPNAGSDLNDIETSATPHEEGFRIDGRKKWITFGQIAKVFVVLAKCEGKSVAFAVPRDTPGICINPIRGMTGTRGAMLAELVFDGCYVTREHLLGRPGFGNVVALTALDLGRYSVACGSVGIAQASLDSSLEYASRVRRSGLPLRDHQLVQQMITEMVSDIAAARLLCRSAGAMMDDKDPRGVQQVFIAKYFASTSAMRASANAVQIHGANGCTPDYPVERYMRDAKVMGIIEGSTQIQQSIIATLEFQEFERCRQLLDPGPGNAA